MSKSISHRIVSRFRKNKTLSYLLKITGRECNPEKWIFIVGCYNSGTTLLEKILSTHPDISSLVDEGVILTDQLKRPEDFGYNRLWYPVMEQLGINHESEQAPRIAETIKKHWSHFFDCKKKIFIEKSISNSLRIDFFHKFFAPAYFIYIIRNGFAVCEGIKRKARPARFANAPVKEYTFEMCAKQWRESDLLIRRSLANKMSLTVSYEDITEDPASVMAEVCRFLDISPFPQETMDKAYKIHGKTSLIENMNHHQIRRLSVQDIATIEQQAREVLEFYNYSI